MCGCPFAFYFVTRCWGYFSTMEDIVVKLIENGPPKTEQ